VAGGTAALALLAVVGLVVLRGRPRPSERPALQRARLAVLPFENLSGDRNQDYLSEGFTEEMITQIGLLSPERLAVIARLSAARYRNTGKDARQIGRELDVDYLLDGSLRREGERIRVSTRLVRVSDESTSGPPITTANCATF